jgi:hypothetical protein
MGNFFSCPPSNAADYARKKYAIKRLAEIIEGYSALKQNAFWMIMPGTLIIAWL